jgi:glycosyltransferase involved in cell wall biosynthesis
VATRIGGTVDVITHGVDGLLVESGDIGGMVETVNRILGDPGLNSRLRAAARRTVETRFTIEGVATHYATLYGRLMKLHPTPKGRGAEAWD